MATNDVQRYIEQRSQRDEAFAQAWEDAKPEYEIMKLIVEGRQSCGLSQQEVADRCGMKHKSARERKWQPHYFDVAKTRSLLREEARDSVRLSRAVRLFQCSVRDANESARRFPFSFLESRISTNGYPKRLPALRSLSSAQINLVMSYIS